MHRPARPAGPAADHVRIQPDDSADVQPNADVELDYWLDDPEFDQEAERLRRLGADEEILLDLQLHEFADDSWEPVAQELARYGLAVLRAWIRRATIYEKVRSRTRYRLEPLDGWPADDQAITDLATDTVIAALKYFKENVLMCNKWDPRRGASLRTFFLGQCLFRFPNHYRSHRDAELARRANEYLVGDDADLAELMGTIGDTEYAVVVRSELDAALASVPNTRLRAALVLRYWDGYSYQDISDMLGMTGPKQVENLITYYQRKQIRRTA